MVGDFCIPRGDRSSCLGLNEKRFNEQYPEQSPSAIIGTTRTAQRCAMGWFLMFAPVSIVWALALGTSSPWSSPQHQPWVFPLHYFYQNAAAFLISSASGASLSHREQPWLWHLCLLSCPHSLHARSFLGLEWRLLSSYNLNYPSFAIL